MLCHTGLAILIGDFAMHEKLSVKLVSSKQEGAEVRARFLVGVNRLGRGRVAGHAGSTIPTGDLQGNRHSQWRFAF